MHWRRLHAVLLISTITITIGCNSGGGRQGASMSERIKDAEEITNPVERSNEFIAIAEVHLDAEDALGAKNCLELAALAADEISVQQEPADRANVFVKLADGWHKAKHLDGFEDACKKAKKAARNIEDAVEKSRVFVDLAQLKIKLDEKKDALKDLKTAEEESEKITYGQERVNMLASVAYGYVQLNDTDEASRVMATAIDLAESEQTPSDKARMMAIIGSKQIKTLDDKEAGMATIEKALEVARSIDGNPYLQANVLIDIADVHVRLKNRQNARELLNEAEEVCKGRSECKPALQKIEKLRGKL